MHKILKIGRRDFGYKNQFSYFYVLNPFLKLTRLDQVRWNIAQLLNATHLLVYVYIYLGGKFSVSHNIGFILI